MSFDKEEYWERRNKGLRGQDGMDGNHIAGVVVGIDFGQNHNPGGSGLRSQMRAIKSHGTGRVRRASDRGA